MRFNIGWTTFAGEAVLATGGKHETCAVRVCPRKRKRLVDSSQSFPPLSLKDPRLDNFIPSSQTFPFVA